MRGTFIIVALMHACNVLTFMCNMYSHSDNSVFFMCHLALNWLYPWLRLNFVLEWMTDRSKCTAPILIIWFEIRLLAKRLTNPQWTTRPPSRLNTIIRIPPRLQHIQLFTNNHFSFSFSKSKVFFSPWNYPPYR